MRIRICSRIAIAWVLVVLILVGAHSVVAGTGVGLNVETVKNLSRVSTLYSQAFRERDLEAMSRYITEILDITLADSAVGGNISRFVILIPNSSYTDVMDQYAQIRIAQGYEVMVHDLSEELGPTFTPHDIRSFLQERYLDGEVRYLLIIGDDELIPMLPAYAHSGNPYTYTDYYYGDLEGNWDVDGDGIYGEMVDDSIDFVPEFIVTRIPCVGPSEAYSALQQALHYRFQYSEAYENGILMAGTISFEGDSGLLQNMISRQLADRDFQTERIYDTDTFRIGGIEVPLNPDYTYDEVTIPQVWNSGFYGLVYDISHGDYYGVPGFESWDVPQLDLPFPGYFVAAACATSYPVYGRNFSEKLIIDGGLAGVIGSTNWVFPGSGALLASGIFAESAFPLAAVQPDIPLGQALNAVKVAYYQLFVEPETDPDWLESAGQNLKGYLFFGDPEVPIRRSSSR